MARAKRKGDKQKEDFVTNLIAKRGKMVKSKEFPLRIVNYLVSLK